MIWVVNCAIKGHYVYVLYINLVELSRAAWTTPLINLHLNLLFYKKIVHYALIQGKFHCNYFMTIERYLYLKNKLETGSITAYKHARMSQ